MVKVDTVIALDVTTKIGNPVTLTALKSKGTLRGNPGINLIQSKMI